MTEIQKVCMLTSHICLDYPDSKCGFLMTNLMCRPSVHLEHVNDPCTLTPYDFLFFPNVTSQLLFGFCQGKYGWRKKGGGGLLFCISFFSPVIRHCLVCMQQTIFFFKWLDAYIYAHRMLNFKMAGIITKSWKSLRETQGWNRGKLWEQSGSANEKLNVGRTGDMKSPMNSPGYSSPIPGSLLEATVSII